MRRFIQALGWIAVAVWSLVAWGSYGLLEFFGGLMARNADLVTSQPEGVEWLAWGLTALQNLGLTAVVIVWAVVSLLILAVTTVLARVVGAASGPAPRRDVPTYAPQARHPAGPPSAVQDLMRRIEKR